MKGSRIAIALLAVVLCLFMVACPKDEEPASAASAPEVQQTTPAAAETPVASEPVATEPVKETFVWDSDLFNTGAVGRNGAAACASSVASQIAVDIMEKGGNAVDAAVAMIYAVGVLEPAATGIGGAGQMTVYLADTDEYVTIEYMTQAPKAAIAGQIDTSTSDNPPSVQAIAIPGVVHGTLTALEKWGTMTAEEVLQPVVDLARNGFKVTSRWNTNIEGRYDNLKAYPYTLGLYTDEGFLYSEGDTIRNKDLADTIEFIGKNGIEGFYNSEFTDKMVDYIQSLGGILTREDFANYTSVVREPISTTYKGYTVYTTGGPSSGGAALLEALNITEQFDISQYEFGSPESVLLKIEAFALGCKDGTAYMGDPDYYNLPVDTIISKEYAQTRAKLITIGEKMKRPAAGALKVTLTDTGKEVQASMAKDQGGTSHMVCMDKYGNVVSTTNTNGINFGSAVAVPGTGFVFSAHLGNLTNTTTASVNMLMPGIRVCSTTCPSIVADETGKPVLAVGSPGNWALVSAAYETIVNFIDYKMDIAQAVNAPRTWKDGQNLKDVYVEGGFPAETIQTIKDKGYTVLDDNLQYSSHVGCIAAIEVRDGLFYAIGDDRRHYGAAAY